MSIITKTGDDGTTALMYNRRVSKCDPRVEAYGAVDELNSALGLARALAKDPAVGETLSHIQKHLIAVMGELATATEDRQRYVKDGYALLRAEMTTELETVAKKLEAEHEPPRGWAVPGTNPSAAALDVARTVARRAERRVCALQDSDQMSHPQVVIYLNRLSDLLWLMARKVERSQS